MDPFDILDVVLYGLMFIDFVIKYIRIRFNTKAIGKVKRYHPTPSTLQLIIYILISIVSIGYFIYRMIMIQQGNLAFAKYMIILPILFYYVIFDLVFNGIYYNQYGCYVKNTMIHFGEVQRCFRYKNEKKNGFDYVIYYEPKLSGVVELDFFVKNEPKAFELLNRIPVTVEQ